LRTECAVARVTKAVAISVTLLLFFDLVVPCVLSRLIFVFGPAHMVVNYFWEEREGKRRD